MSAPSTRCMRPPARWPSAATRCSRPPSRPCAGSACAPGASARSPPPPWSSSTTSTAAPHDQPATLIVTGNGSVCSRRARIAGRSSVNTGAPWPELSQAVPRVLAMQTKLHRWATADPGRRFDDLANLVYDPAFLTVAWDRVRGNAGARTAGVDRIAPRSVGEGAAELLADLRQDLKSGAFAPLRVREKTIPKAAGKLRRLGIPTTVTGSCRR